MKCPNCNNEMLYNTFKNSYECLNCKLGYKTTTTAFLQVPHYEIYCLICGELVKKVYEINERHLIEVCDKCKKAVMKMREKIDGN